MRLGRLILAAVLVSSVPALAKQSDLNKIRNLARTPNMSRTPLVAVQKPGAAQAEAIPFWRAVEDVIQGGEGSVMEGYGDVVGPASATDDNVVLFDGTTGKLIKDGFPVTAAARTVVDDATVDDMLTTLGGTAPTGSGAICRAITPTLDTPLVYSPGFFPTIGMRGSDNVATTNFTFAGDPTVNRTVTFPHDEDGTVAFTSDTCNGAANCLFAASTSEGGAATEVEAVASGDSDAMMYPCLFPTFTAGDRACETDQQFEWNSITNILSVDVNGDVTGDLTGNADTVTTNANLTGDVTSSGNATTIAADAVEDSMLRESAAVSVIGNDTNATANPADIAAGTIGDVLTKDSGTSLAFGNDGMLGGISKSHITSVTGPTSTTWVNMFPAAHDVYTMPWAGAYKFECHILLQKSTGAGSVSPKFRMLSSGGTSTGIVHYTSSDATTYLGQAPSYMGHLRSFLTDVNGIVGNATTLASRWWVISLWGFSNSSAGTLTPQLSFSGGTHTSTIHWGTFCDIEPTTPSATTYYNGGWG